ncbi:MAG: STT3 domain-containing protein [Haloarculaceae archaeon]
MSDEETVTAILDDRPDLESALAAVLATDEREEYWSFEDVPVDSGEFGELVAADIVEETDEGYHLVDPASVHTALNGDEERQSTDRTTSSMSVSLPAIDRRTVAFVGASLAFVALVRAFPVGDVFREAHVVLSGNDPYYYRYWMEHLVGSGASPFDPGALAALPDAVRTGEPLMVTVLWWFVALLGEGPRSVGTVLAWYPVVSAVVSAALVYALATTVTRDRRVGLASVLVLALIPGHALRTSLGFADHHAFDYLVLSVSTFLLVALLAADRSDITDPGTTLRSSALGIALSGQVLAWEAGPLLIAPVGLVVVAHAARSLRDGRSPFQSGGPLLVALGVSAVSTALVHLLAGWQSTTVAIAPGLVFLGSLAVAAVGHGVDRTTGNVRHFAVVVLSTVLGGVAVLRLVTPGLWSAMVSRAGLLFRSANIAETYGLFDPHTLGFLLLFGFTLVLALPMMVTKVQRALESDRWLALVIYAWYFFALAALQVRFVGEFALLAAVFAGFGFVRLAAWVDLVDLPGSAVDEIDRPAPLRLPDRRTLSALLALFLLFGSFGALQVVLKTNQVTIEDSTYDTAVAIEHYAGQLDEGAHPTYVFSSWSRNRVYNYFVNGESKGYGFARFNYNDFVTSTSPDGWYELFNHRDVGYIVLTENGDVPRPTMQTRLFRAYGSRQGDVPGLANYRLIYVHDGGSPKVFSVVSGANIHGEAPNGTVVSITTNVTVSGHSFAYERRQVAGTHDQWRIRVPYPGRYTVRVGNDTSVLQIPGPAIYNGTRFRVGS